MVAGRSSRLRILHDGHAALRILDDEDRILLVDPFDTAGYTDIKGRHATAVLVSGGPWWERWQGAYELVRAGRKPVIVGSAETVAGLASLGQIDGRTPPCSVDGFEIEAASYTPHEPKGARRDKLRAAVTKPRWALARFQSRRALADAEPLAWRLTIPKGHQIAHLGLSLHSQTPSAFLAKARLLCEGAIVIAGYPHGEGEAFVEHMTALQPKKLVLMDQGNDLRRDAGLPTELVTPVRDVLVSRGIETHVFVSAVSIRFDINDTIKRW